MDFVSFRIYLHNAFPNLPWWHWGVMLVVMVVAVQVFKKYKDLSLYASVALAFSFFIGMFLLDGMVLNRLYSERVQFSSINIRSEYHRIREWTIGMRVMMLFNVTAFFPFGATLSEFLFSTRRSSATSNIGLVSVAAFGLSLLIECLQLLLKVGLFEIMDMILNTLGAIIGSILTLSVRKIVC